MQRRRFLRAASNGPHKDIRWLTENEAGVDDETGQRRLTHRTSSHPNTHYSLDPLTPVFPLSAPCLPCLPCLSLSIDNSDS